MSASMTRSCEIRCVLLVSYICIINDTIGDRSKARSRSFENVVVNVDAKQFADIKTYLTVYKISEWLWNDKINAFFLALKRKELKIVLRADQYKMRGFL